MDQLSDKDIVDETPVVQQDMAEEEVNEEMKEETEEKAETDNELSGDVLPSDEDMKTTKSGKKVVKISDNKANKRGILYLSYIPIGLNVNKIRQILSEFGEVDRIFLQKERTPKVVSGSAKRALRKKSYNCRYVEGWVEFRKKSVAKSVSNLLNGKQIGGKRKSKFYDQIWSLKYLHKFKWSHLAEQLSYEKALTQQKLRFEISRAKKETSFYEQMSHKSKYNSRHKSDEQSDETAAHDRRHYKQRVTDELIRKNKTTADNGVDFELLSKIFQ